MVKQSLDAVYAALADPTRRGIVERLRRGPTTMSELAAPYDMTLAAVGKHVTVLERAGITRSRKVGRVRTCTVVDGAFVEATEWLNTQEQFWNERLDALERFVEADE